MSASGTDRRHVRAAEGAIESQVLLGEMTRLDGAIDIRRARCEQFIGEAQQQLATVDRLDRLSDETRGRLATTLRALAGEIDGVVPA